MMKNKIVLAITFLIFLVLFGCVIKTSKVTLKLASSSGYDVVFEYVGTDKLTQQINKIISKDDERVKTRFEPRNGFGEFSISLRNAPAQLTIRDMNVFNTIFPFYVSGKNIEKYFELNDIDCKIDGKEAVLTFKSLSSKLLSKPILTNTILVLKLLVVLLMALVATVIVFGFVQLDRKKGSYVVAFTLISMVFALPLLAFPIPLQSLLALKGTFDKKYCPVVSIKTFHDRQFQKKFEDYFNQNVTLSNINIRLFNTVYYWLLEKSFSFDQGIVIGENRTLFEKGYITEVIKQDAVDDVKLKKIVKDLKQIQNYYKKQNKLFIFMITPSKAVFDEDKLPETIQATDFSKNIYTVFVNEMHKNKVNLIDTPALIEQKKDEHIIFPKGGIHWGDYPKYIALKAIVDKIDTTSYLKKKLNPLNVEAVVTSDYAYSEDADLVDLANLISPPAKYPVETIVYKENPTPSTMEVKFIGGSFLNGPVEMLAYSNTVSSVDYYFYFFSKKVYQKYYDIKEDTRFGSDEKLVINDINKGDVIILEVNQQVLSQYGEKHIIRFIDAMQKYVLK